MLCTHNEPDNRADMELTDGTAAKRAKLFDTSSSSFSSHEVAPNLHDLFGGIGDPGTRAMKISRVDADMEITAIDALTNAKLEVDRALDMASKTLHRLLEEIPLQNSTASETSESTLRCTRAKPTPRLSAAIGC